MTDRPELAEGRYLHVTPAGAWRAVRQPDAGPCEALVRALLTQERTALLERRALAGWAGCDEDEAVARLARAQAQGWVEGLAAPRAVRAEPLEGLLPELLGPLSSGGRALLADQQGFCLSTIGFGRQAATDLSALSADLASLQERHRTQLAHLAEGPVGAWALVDEVGNSHVGFWPLHIGGQRFVLVAADLPYLHHPHLAELIWVLSTRYGLDTADHQPPRDHRSRDERKPTHA